MNKFIWLLPMVLLASCAPKKEMTTVYEVSAPAPTDIASIVDPCGTSPAISNEVFIRLQNGYLIASYSDSSSGANTRFVLIKPGNYVTTDGDYCYFTVTADYQVTNEHH